MLCMRRVRDVQQITKAWCCYLVPGELESCCSQALL
jgi:hypothetical protein